MGLLRGLLIEDRDELEQEGILEYGKSRMICWWLGSEQARVSKQSLSHPSDRKYKGIVCICQTCPQCPSFPILSCSIYQNLPHHHSLITDYTMRRCSLKSNLYLLPLKPSRNLISQEHHRLITFQERLLIRHDDLEVLLILEHLAPTSQQH